MLSHLTSSVGKKYLMAITGQCFCAFLVAHLAGNLALFAGKDTFNAYAEKLEGLWFLVIPAEIFLILLALIHIFAAINLTIQNRRARPVKYYIDNSGGQKKWASSTMIFSGLVTLVFLVLHITTFKFGQRGETGLYGVVQSYFAQPLWVAFYVISVAFLSMHLSHGFQSAFQSLGLNHPKFTPIIKKLGILYALAMWAGYTTLPIWMHLCKGVTQ